MTEYFSWEGIVSEMKVIRTSVAEKKNVRLQKLWCVQIKAELGLARCQDFSKLIAQLGKFILGRLPERYRHSVDWSMLIF